MTEDEQMSDVMRRFFLTLRGTPFGQVIADIKKFKDEPRMMVIIAHAFLELIVNRLVAVKCKNWKKIVENNRDFPQSIKLTMLNEMGVLSDHHLAILNWFRKLRNEAAHKWIFKFGEDDLNIFAKPIHREPSNFHNLCVAIIYDLIHEHNDELLPEFIPSLAMEKKPVLMVEVKGVKYSIPLANDPEKVSIPFDEYLNLPDDHPLKIAGKGK